MSTISTPLPSSFDKRPLVIGLGVAGLLVAGVVVAQNVSLPTTTSSTTTTTAAEPRAGGPDAIEARQNSALVRAGGPDALAARAQAESARVERQLDSLVKTQGNYSGVSADASSYRVGGSTWLSQVPAAAIAGAAVIPSLRVDTVVNGVPYGGRGYGDSGTSGAAAMRSLRVDTVVNGVPYGGRGYGATGVIAAAAVPASVVAQQVGGLHTSYAFTGTTGLSSVAKSQIGGQHGTYAYKAGSSHMVWNDTYVPPFTNPEWMPLIQKHYFGARSGE